MTRRCRDFSGPAEPVIATSRGWVPLDEPHAAHLAASGMLLACSPEHVAQLLDGELLSLRHVAERLGVSRGHVIRLVNAGELEGRKLPDSSDWTIPLASVVAFEERAERAGQMADELSRSLDALGAPLE